MDSTMNGHNCENLNGMRVPWDLKDCLCNPNLMEEIEAESTFELVNLTPHDINIKLENQDAFMSIAPSGIVTRCDTDYKNVDSIIVNGETFDIRERFFKQPYDLPEPKEGTYFIVSRIVAEACANVRDDLLIVDGTIREKVDGRMVVVGCEGLAQWPKSEPSEADKLLQMVLNNADEADLDDEVYLDNDIVNRITAYLLKTNQGICDDGIQCLQNKEVYLNEHDRCGACQEQRDYEDDKFPKEE